MKEALTSAGLFDPKEWKKFSSLLYYHPIEYDDPASFASLADRLSELDLEFGTGGNKLFYLAIPPPFTNPRRNAGQGRPFRGRPQKVPKVDQNRGGKTLRSGSEDGHRPGPNPAPIFSGTPDFQDRSLSGQRNGSEYFDVSVCQCHFEPMWNRRYIESVHIIAAETMGWNTGPDITIRPGVLRDMFQNHMMQLLALDRHGSPFSL
jgi:glucose-6-phosphate 1-dehydrogenase